MDTNSKSTIDTNGNLTTDTNAVITAIAERMSHNIGTRAITHADLIEYMVEITQLVEKYPALTGFQKKSCVINVLKKIIEASSLEDSSKTGMMVVADALASPVVDALISASKGLFELNTVTKTCKCF